MSRNHAQFRQVQDGATPDIVEQILFGIGFEGDTAHFLAIDSY